MIPLTNRCEARTQKHVRCRKKAHRWRAGRMVCKTHNLPKVTFANREFCESRHPGGWSCDRPYHSIDTWHRNKVVAMSWL
jgi:hypothetical protein